MNADQAALAIEALSARLDRLAADLGFASETPAIAALLARKAEIEAAIAGGDERLAAMAQQQAMLDRREVALDQRDRQIKIREFQFDQKVEDATAQLRSNYLALAQSDRALKLRVMNFSGMLSGFDIGIMALPDWSALEKMLGVADAIPEMQDTPELTREGWSGDKFSAQSTLTRSLPMAAMASHDDQPMPKPPVRKRPSRGGYRAAYRRALASP